MDTCVFLSERLRWRTRSDLCHPKGAEIAGSLAIKVYYEDTDAAGVVYYANYLRFMERGRTELLAQNQFDVAKYHSEGFIFAVVHVDIQYRRPARLGEIIEVRTEITNMGNASVSFLHEIFRGTELLTSATVKLACIDANGKPRRVPPELHELKH